MQMKTVFFSWLLLLFSFPLSAEERDRTISVLAHGELYQLAQDPEVSTAVISQNSKKISLEQIVRQDKIWQGDEAKFQKAMNKGVGAVVIDALQFDESAQMELIQVTVPVMLQEEAIGAVTFGIDPKKLLGK
jgi:hypothetical protein